MAIQLSAQLYRCADGELLWESIGEATVDTEDDHLIELTQAYRNQLGSASARFASPAFALLQSMLADLPDISLTENEIIEKIELE